MKKSELIAKLQEIEGDPEVFVTSVYGDTCAAEFVENKHVFDAKYPTHISRHCSVDAYEKFNYTGYTVEREPYNVIYITGYTSFDA